MIDSNNEELGSITDLLKKMAVVKDVSAFDSFSIAQKYFERHTADLILLDADNEEIGWAIPYRKIKAINETAKVVLISRNEAAAVKAYEAGVWDYLLKPVKRKQLERILEKSRDG